MGALVVLDIKRFLTPTLIWKLSSVHIDMLAELAINMTSGGRLSPYSQLYRKS